VARSIVLILLVALLASWQPSHGQLGQHGLSLPDADDRLPDGSSQTIAIVKDDQQKSLEDIEKIKTALEALEKDLSRSEFLVSLDALKNANEIEKLAQNIQSRLKRRR
jgi:hypothetical protein